MRRVTRNLLIAIALVVVALLALGALPQYLGSGDPYYLTAESVEHDGAAVDVSEVSERRFPYLTSALTADDGRSDPYLMGPYGIKESFTHTPFDELGELTQRVPDAVEGAGVYVETEGETYYVEVVQPEA